MLSLNCLYYSKIFVIFMLFLNPFSPNNGKININFPRTFQHVIKKRVMRILKMITKGKMV